MKTSTTCRDARNPVKSVIISLKASSSRDAKSVRACPSNVLTDNTAACRSLTGGSKALNCAHKSSSNRGNLFSGERRGYSS